MAVVTDHLHRRRGRQTTALLAGVAVGTFAALPVLAQVVNFDSVTLAEENSSATVNGFTRGIFALSDIAGRDRRGGICTGFADADPDHILVLDHAFSTLTLQVNSGGNDTSLLVQGPDGSVRCGEDSSRRNPDARIQDQDWAPGTYLIWVGSHQQGQRYSYALTIRP
jgi:hypothetical protein